MSSPENNNPSSDDQFSDLVADIDITPEASHESQKTLFEAIKRRHDSERQDAEITRIAIDHLPLDAVGTGAGISLRFVKPDPKVEKIFLRINYPITSKNSEAPVTQNIFLDIAQRSEGIITPINTFSPDQADLVFKQADELTLLRDQGYIPDLTADLSDIFDLSTAMRKYVPPNPSD
jgi:hypothetical protein